MKEMQHKPFLHTGKIFQFTGMKNNHIPKNSDLWRIFTQGQKNFTLTASLPLWINLQFLKTSWKGVIFCHLKL
jgi:hypothetical protein